MLCKLWHLYAVLVSNWHALGRALDYHSTIDSYISWNKDLHTLELSNTDWESINLVMTWLKSFNLLLLRCLPQKFWCSQWHMPSFEGYKMTSRISFMTFPTQYCPESNSVSQMHTGSLVTTTTSMTCPPSTHGLHVSMITNLVAH